MLSQLTHTILALGEHVLQVVIVGIIAAVLKVLNDIKKKIEEDGLDI